jgi:hypothetical protein
MIVKDFKKPDLNAPRYVQQLYKVDGKTFLKDFFKKHPEHIGLSWQDSRKIIGHFNQQISDHIVHNREGVELPERLGHLFIGTCVRPKVVKIDYDLSAKLNTRIRHRNFKSDDFLAKIFYTSYSSRYCFKHKELWNFTGCRDLKRNVAKVYPEKWKIFVQVENKRHISKAFVRIQQKEWSIKNNESFVIDPEYNEFEIN